jgi:hypothetical protein
MSLNLQDFAHIATIITGLGVFGIACQVLYSHKQLKADHERSRREKSVDILMVWSKNLKKEGSIARKIIECLNEEQCRDVFNQQSVSISRKHENLIKQLFKAEHLPDIDQAGNEVTLTEAQSTELRWHAITYLNTLEFSLVAWQYSVVDKNIIESQFQYLFRPADGHEVLKHFRKAAGGENSYPAIEIFTAHISEKRRKNLIQKSEVF